jgi:hypothetical protein
MRDLEHLILWKGTTVGTEHSSVRLRQGFWRRTLTRAEADVLETKESKGLTIASLSRRSSASSLGDEVRFNAQRRGSLQVKIKRRATCDVRLGPTKKMISGEAAD